MTDDKVPTVRALRELARQHLGRGHSKLKTKEELLQALKQSVPELLAKLGDMKDAVLERAHLTQKAQVEGALKNARSAQPESTPARRHAEALNEAAKVAGGKVAGSGTEKAAQPASGAVKPVAPAAIAGTQRPPTSSQPASAPAKSTGPAHVPAPTPGPTSVGVAKAAQPVAAGVAETANSGLGASAAAQRSRSSSEGRPQAFAPAAVSERASVDAPKPASSGPGVAPQVAAPNHPATSAEARANPPAPDRVAHAAAPKEAASAQTRLSQPEARASGEADVAPEHATRTAAIETVPSSANPPPAAPRRPPVTDAFFHPAPPAPAPRAHAAEPLIEGFFVARIAGEREARRHRLTEAQAPFGQGRVPHPFEERLGELPPGYTEHEGVLLARDPSTLFFFWDFHPDARLEAAEGLHLPRLLLQIFEGGHFVREEEFPLEAKSVYLHGLIPGRTYRVEALVRGADGRTAPMRIASNPVTLPPEAPSGDLSVQMLQVPWGAQLARYGRVLPGAADHLGLEGLAPSGSSLSWRGAPLAPTHLEEGMRPEALPSSGQFTKVTPAEPPPHLPLPPSASWRQGADLPTSPRSGSGRG